MKRPLALLRRLFPASSSPPDATEDRIARILRERVRIVLEFGK